MYKTSRLSAQFSTAKLCSPDAIARPVVQIHGFSAISQAPNVSHKAGTGFEAKCTCLSFDASDRRRECFLSQLWIATSLLFLDAVQATISGSTTAHSMPLACNIHANANEGIGGNNEQACLPWLKLNGYCAGGGP